MTIPLRRVRHISSRNAAGWKSWLSGSGASNFERTTGAAQSRFAGRAGREGIHHLGVAAPASFSVKRDVGIGPRAVIALRALIFLM
jgi:hypothetical protein